jgi:putative copper resistance protein D
VVAAIMGGSGVDLPTALGAGVIYASLTEVVAAMLIAVVTVAKRPNLAMLFACAAAILVASTMMSHSVARLEDRVPLAIVFFCHQLGAAAWIGGIPYLIAALARAEGASLAITVAARFSSLAMGAVGLLIVAGLAMAYAYLGSFQAIYGTSYGAMVTTKVAMLGGLLCLGAANFFLVRRARRAPDTPLIRLRRFAEAEVGVGVAVFLCAASLTSTPPAVDIPDQTASFAEVVHRITPQWPRMTSPSHSETSIQQLQAKLDAQASTRSTAARAYIPGAGVPPPSNASDIAWSEFNHHWSGVFVLIVGLLALAERAGARWARHWPLAFLLLAAFLFIRSDPKYWPLGSIPFWEGMRDAEALQHRAAVLVVILLAGFEWAVRNGRLTSPRAALVFPLLCAVGGAMLLTHSHSIADLKEELLVELTHLPLALLSLAAGWSRWLELRLPGPEGRAYGWVWPTSIALIGVLLLLYREA